MKSGAKTVGQRGDIPQTINKPPPSTERSVRTLKQRWHLYFFFSSSPLQPTLNRKYAVFWPRSGTSSCVTCDVCKALCCVLIERDAGWHRGWWIKAPYKVPIYMQCLSGHLSRERWKNSSAQELCNRTGDAARFVEGGVIRFSCNCGCKQCAYLSNALHGLKLPPRPPKKQITGGQYVLYMFLNRCPSYLFLLTPD